jgi:aldose 1-epimerase
MPESMMGVAVRYRGVRDTSDEELPPSGLQLTIGDGHQQVVVTDVGASLREFTLDGRRVVWPYPAGEMSSGGRGQVLAPWPNRVEDGSYLFGGVEAHVPLDEPDRHNAIHGLVRWLTWHVDEHAERSVTLSCMLAPQPAYPWRLALSLRYALADGGLIVEASAENRSVVSAPFGMGAHPYLDAGPAGVDGCALRLPASRHLMLDARGIPRGSERIEETAFDFRRGRELAGVRLDDCFTDLWLMPDEEVPAQAAWQAVLSTGDGHRSALWADEAWPYVMCYTGDTLAPADRRRGVAIEPMTCPPNALRSGEAVVTIAPRARWSGMFGIRVID